MTEDEARAALEEVRATLRRSLYQECRLVVGRGGQARYQPRGRGYRIGAAPTAPDGSQWAVWVTGPDADHRWGYLKAIREAGGMAEKGPRPGTRSVPSVVVTKSPPPAPDPHAGEEEVWAGAGVGHRHVPATDLEKVIIQTLINNQLKGLPVSLAGTWVPAGAGFTCPQCSGAMERSVHLFAGPFGGSVRCTACPYRDSVMNDLGRRIIRVDPLPEGALPIYDADPDPPGDV